LADVVSIKKRSEMMSGIRSKNTRPELLIRKALHQAGFRFRIHQSDLPGKPDLVLPKYKAAIFIHGCFWHGHECHLFKWPSTRADFWKMKINRNREKDRESLEKLHEQQWRVLIIWECAIKGRDRLDLSICFHKITKWVASKVKFKVIEGKTRLLFS